MSKHTAAATSELFRKLVNSLDRKLPIMPDPDASLDDICVEVEITWREWKWIKEIVKAEGSP